jgi:hypothetical protein
MEEYCVNICFDSIRLDSFYKLMGSKPVGGKIHAHIIIQEDDIQVKFIFDTHTHFEYKFSNWLQTISPLEIGKYLRVEIKDKRPNFFHIIIPAAIYIRKSWLIFLKFLSQSIPGYYTHISFRSSSLFYKKVLTYL